MRILVTGGAGFIGSAVVRALLAGRASQVTVLDTMTYAANPATLAPLLERENFALIKGDIRNPETVRTAYEQAAPQAVMHLAAESHVDRSIDAASDFITTNVIGTQVMLDAALDWSAGQGEVAKPEFRFLHISTDEVFGDLGPDDKPFDPNALYRPRSPYAASKASSDHLAKAWGETYGLPVILTNCSNNFGPFQHPEKLIPMMIIRALRGLELPVYGDGAQIRDWLHVDDHVSGLITALEAGEPGRSYLFGARQERTNLEVVEAICAQMDKRFPERAPHRQLVRHVKDRPGHDRRYAIDAARAESELGWRPRLNFETGLDATIDWYLAREDWWSPTVDLGALARQGQIDGT